MISHKYFVAVAGAIALSITALAPTQLNAQTGCKMCSIWYEGGGQQHAECLTSSGPGTFHNCYTDGVTCSMSNPCGKILTHSDFLPDGSLRQKAEQPLARLRGTQGIRPIVILARGGASRPTPQRAAALDCRGRIVERHLTISEISAARSFSRQLTL